MSNEPKTKNDIAWQSLFEKYDILNKIDRNGSFKISAEQIKEFREPRLMAKFDHKINLPKLFSDNNLAILPISRGDYEISNFEAYKPFENIDSTLQRVSLPTYIQSLNSSSITSEAIAINCALATGMLTDFFEDQEIIATVNGRMGSDKFGFNILNNKNKQKSTIQVSNSQIEIDAAYEGINYLSLIEAKRDISDDFLIRQLYYPFRLWSSKVTKKVKSVFLVYTNGIFTLYEYAFQDPMLYNSLRLIKQKNYTIEDTEIELSDIEDVFKNVHIINEPEIPFPQANSFNRIINLCELLTSSPLSRENVTDEYAFDVRQTNYYTDAGRYLGLIEKSYESGRKPVYTLTSEGKRILNLSFKQRQLLLVKHILQHKVFHDTFELCLKYGEMPDTNQIVSIMKKYKLYHIGQDKTFARRSSTITGWLNWILGLQF